MKHPLAGFTNLIKAQAYAVLMVGKPEELVVIHHKLLGIAQALDEMGEQLQEHFDLIDEVAKHIPPMKED